ncbi:MAG: hypothetical protein BWY53_00510 [Parcubacteria group bacterium ADurb.Bin326]|nr:MAG: hypothetical protein BWY53_00510 [Parcubacteria group bacterium ADurb.Bin326]
MESIKSIIRSNYTGSQVTKQAVAEELERRYGKEEAAKYDPYTNCLTFKQWLANKFRVRKGEKSIQSITFVESKDENGEVIATFPRKIHLFYYLQVEPISN